jgi:hypothetical protein
MKTKKIKQLTEEQFDKLFNVQINHIERANQPINIGDEDICSFGGCMYETYGEELKYVLEMAKLNRVVTIIEGEDVEDENGEVDEVDEDGDVITHSTIFYGSGYHLVNRIGFLVLDKPYKNDFEVLID